MLTTWGRAVCAAGAVVATAGWWVGWQELSIAGSACVAVALAALLASLGPIRYRALIDLPRTRASVGDLLVMTVQVTNAARWRALPPTLVLPIGPAVWRRTAASLGPGSHHAEVIELPTHRRAVLAVGPLSVVRADPLGLAARGRRVSDRYDVVVHPQIRPMPGLGSGLVRDMDGAVTPALADASLAFHALRPYVRGDDRRHIHWRTSARMGTLMVRQWEDTRRSAAIVALDTLPASYAREDDFELAVSACASIAVQCIQDGCDVAVGAGGQRPRGATPMVLLDQLAGVSLEAGGATATSCPAASAAVSHAPAAGTCLVVTGPDVALDAVVATLARLSLTTTGLVIRCRDEPEQEPRLSRLGRVTCLDVGSLDGLARALAAVAV